MIFSDAVSTCIFAMAVELRSLLEDWLFNNLSGYFRPDDHTTLVWRISKMAAVA